jgi:hypothetical protein
MSNEAQMVSVAIPREDEVKLRGRFGDKWEEYARGAIHGWLVRLEAAEWMLRRDREPFDPDAP